MSEPNAEQEYRHDAGRDEVDLEAPEADVLDQRASTRADPEAGDRGPTPFEADAADAAEQGYDVGDVGDDEDEYRES